MVYMYDRALRHTHGQPHDNLDPHTHNVSVMAEKQHKVHQVMNVMSQIRPLANLTTFTHLTH